jgi:hypothetical protein
MLRGWPLLMPMRPRWWLAIHIPGALIWSFAHVMGFLALRKLAYWALGSHYDFGEFWPNILYELRKDSFGYVMFIAGSALIERLLRREHRAGRDLRIAELERQHAAVDLGVDQDRDRRKDRAEPRAELGIRWQGPRLPA